ncbi:MAG: AGE family epimerase/isomerase [Treponema sp.]|jgi:mannobiose 2-epimerase|nr:AGE family epimerase/isomerase [Treponema sp.]
MTLIQECKDQLTQKMLPFWSSLGDTKYGGFIGEHDGKNPIPDAVKGSIYHARILWFFSKCALTLGREDALKSAEQAYRFIRDALIDPENGGVYWSTDYTGKPKDTDKHAYAIAFTLYGLSAYCQASGSKEALRLAQSVFACLETKCRTALGYNEQFDIAFNPKENRKLSETLYTPKTMNTMLHILEAYTEFYHAAIEGREALDYIYNLLMDKVLSGKGRMDLFFDDALRPQSDEKSYGHDIEASWLLTEAGRATGHLEGDVKRILHLADVTLAEGFDGQALSNERKGGREDTDRIWWVQAETVVGLANAWGLTGDKRYLDMARAVWEYIKTSLIGDKEWLGGRTKDGRPFTQSIAGMWKCPYHNGRMFIEIIRRKVDF